jgi:segregation and condensation protein B
MPSTINSKRILEALLFASDTPVEVKRLRDIIPGVTEDELLALIDTLNGEYEREGRPFRVIEVAGGFQYETTPPYGIYIEKLFHTRVRPKLSRAALETLAIVAYRQPISKVDIDALRGVDADASLHTLQNRDLIEERGRADTVGKSILYGTTQEFLRYFGLNNIKDLPGADELASMFDGTPVEKSGPEQLSFDTE